MVVEVAVEPDRETGDRGSLGSGDIEWFRLMIERAIGDPVPAAAPGLKTATDDLSLSGETPPRFRGDIAPLVTFGCENELTRAGPSELGVRGDLEAARLGEELEEVMPEAATVVILPFLTPPSGDLLPSPGAMLLSDCALARCIVPFDDGSRGTETTPSPRDSSPRCVRDDRDLSPGVR